MSQAAFHLQQAVVKVLKALLVDARQEVRKTHDIDTLVAMARPHWPHLIPIQFPLSFVSYWYITSRYPSADLIAIEPAEILEA